MPTKTQQWETVVKDDRGEKEGESGDWEIAVVRCDNAHGKESYGWSGEDKIIISDTFGDGSGVISKNVFDAMLRVAEDICKDLNAGHKVHIPVQRDSDED